MMLGTSKSKDVVINIEIWGWHIILLLALAVVLLYVIPFIVDSYAYKIDFELNPQVVNSCEETIRLAGFVKRGWIFSKSNIQGLDVEIWLRTPRERILIGWSGTGEDGGFSHVLRIPPGSLPGKYVVEVTLVMDENVKAEREVLFVQAGSE
jgi:hypothetical protein